MALNFLYAVESCPVADVTCFYLVAKDSDVHRHLQRQENMRYVTAPRNAILRILFEVFAGWYFLTKLKIDIVYSYFGYAWFPRRWPQISGSVDSNLYFPEIDFWQGHHGAGKLKRRLLDFYRIRGVKRSNAVVFENEALEERGRLLYGLGQTKFIKPSICLGENRLDFTLPPLDAPDVKRGLFLCGWQLNKNFMLIPPLAAEMRKRNRPFAFVLTAPADNSDQHRQFCESLRTHDVVDRVFVTGPARKDELASLYGQIDYVFLLSKLESFSNNIIEAWCFGKPLLIADEPWAHSICQDAAVYVDRDSVADIADKLCCLLDSSERRALAIRRGTEMLGQYPSIQGRIKEEIDYVRHVFQQNETVSSRLL